MLDVIKNMHNILNKSVLRKESLGLLKILTALKRRRSKKGIVANLMDTEGPSSEKPQENYGFIAKQIKRAEKKYKSILFASVGLGSLPVTIPVNVAIRLAKDKKRCLLIDLDLRRDAIAKVFELDSNKDGLSPKAVQTEFENLWVWPGHNFAQLKQMNIKAIVQKALNRFDFILINAPSLASSLDRRQIISAAQAAFICTKSASEATKLAELMKPLNCMVIGRVQTPL